MPPCLFRPMVPRIAQSAWIAAVASMALSVHAWQPVPLPSDVLFESIRLHDGRLHGGGYGAASSPDFGATWRAENVPSYTGALRFELVSASGGLWGFAGRYGAFRWTGVTWEAWNQGLPILGEHVRYTWMTSNGERLALSAVDQESDSCFVYLRGAGDAAWRVGRRWAGRNCEEGMIAVVRTATLGTNGSGKPIWAGADGVAHAATGDLESAGDFVGFTAAGDTAIAIAQDDQNRNRLLRSIDGGRSWTITARLRDTTLHPMLVQDDGVFFVGRAADGGMLRSRDGGAAWESISVSDTLGSIYDVTGAGDTILVSCSKGTVLSTDRGKVWNLLPRNDQRGHARSLTRLGDRLVVLQSAWGTADVLSFGTGALPSAPLARVRRAYRAYAAGGVLLAVSRDTILRSADGGTTWESVRMPFLTGSDEMDIGTNGAIAVATSQGMMLRTNDTGRTWTPTGLAPRGTVAILPIGHAVLVGSTHWGEMGDTGGVSITLDSGKSWERRGLSGISLRDLKISGGRLFAASGKGLHMSSDTGRNWMDIRISGLPQDLEATSIAVDGHDIAAIVFSHDAWRQKSSAWVVRSRDLGATWEALPADGIAPNLVEFGPRGLYVSTLGRGLWLWDGSASAGASLRGAPRAKAAVSASIHNRAGHAILRYVFVLPGKAHLELCDASGRVVLSRSFAAAAQGELALPDLGARLLLGRLVGPGGSTLVRVAPGMTGR